MGFLGVEEHNEMLGIEPEVFPNDALAFYAKDIDALRTVISESYEVAKSKKRINGMQSLHDVYCKYGGEAMCPVYFVVYPDGRAETGWKCDFHYARSIGLDVKTYSVPYLFVKALERFIQPL